MSTKRVPFNHAASHGSGGADRIPGLYLGAWNAGVAYKVGDVVSKAGVIYRCILAHTNQAPPNATYWTAETTSGGGSGDVVGPSSSVDSEVALFSGTTGKLIKRAAATGIAKLTSGVLSAVTTWAGAALTGTASQVATFDGSGNPSSKAVGTGAGTIAAGDDSRFIPAASATDKVLARTSSGGGPWQETAFGDDVQAIAALGALSVLHRLRAPVLDHAGTWAWGSPFPAPWSRWSAQTVLTGTSAADHGEGNVTTSGTPDADDDDTYGPGKRWKTAASAGAAGGFRAPSMSMMRGKWNPSWTYRFKLGTSTNQRFYAGLASATFTDSDTPTNGHWIALRHSTVAGDATFKVLSRDGTTISSATDTTITPVAGNEYALMVWSTDAGASWKVRLRDITAAAEAEVTHSGNLPDPSTGMGYHCIIWAQEAVLKSHTQRAVFTRLKEFV